MGELELGCEAIGNGLLAYSRYCLTFSATVQLTEGIHVCVGDDDDSAMIMMID